MEGMAGEALFWAYYSRYTNCDSHSAKITPLLSVFFDRIKNGSRRPDFASGIAGVGWTVEHLSQNNFIKANTNKIIGNLDDYLYPYMMRYMRDGNYDYLHGALGVGMFYLDRQNARNRRYLADLIDELETQSVKIDGGTAWIKKNQDSDLMEYNFSLSHGVASIIVFLSRIYEAEIKKDKVFLMINISVIFLLRNK